MAMENLYVTIDDFGNSWNKIKCDDFGNSWNKTKCSDDFGNSWNKTKCIKIGSSSTSSPPDKGNLFFQ